MAKGEYEKNRLRITDGSDIADVLVAAVSGEKGLRVFIGETDPISDIPVVVDAPTHQVNLGEAYQWTYGPAALGDTVSIDHRIVVGALADPARAPHLVVEVDSTVEAWFHLFEGPTITGNGTQKTPVNRNRNSANTMTATIWEAPTNSALGTQLTAGIANVSKFAAPDPGVVKFALKASTTYLFRLTAKAANCNVCIRFKISEDKA